MKALSSGEADFDLMFVPDVVREVEKATPIVILAGQHVGCFELFASGRIRAVRDLKHKTVAVREVGETEHLFLSLILSYVGIDPVKDIRWVTVPFPEAVQLLTVEKIRSSVSHRSRSSFGPRRLGTSFSTARRIGRGGSTSAVW